MDELKTYLKMMQEKEGSDLYLSTGAKPSLKSHGKLISIGESPLPKGAVKALAYGLMDEDQKRDFEKNLEMNLAISESGIGRFRVNIFIQRAEVSMVIRSIETDIPNMANLGLPKILKDVVMEKRGLVLLVGATGSGKSTTLASMIDHRNQNSFGHIITIEDPIEFVHSHKNCVVNQREVGVDTLCYEEALKNTLRQAPDVILIGEIRARETMEHAIAFAETGHLCLSTLHANNANQALDRIINFFPEERRNQLLLDLSFNMKAIISQRLIPTVDGKRAVAVEVLLGTPLVLSLIQRGEVESIKSVMEKSTNLGMQTFDQALEQLYHDGKITLEEALRNADSKNNLRIKIQLSENENQNTESNQITMPQPEPIQNTPQNQPTPKPPGPDSGLSLVDD